MSEVVRFLGRPVLEALTPAEVRSRGSRAQLYALREPFGVVLPGGEQLVVPAGFVSDFASVPAAAHWYLDDEAPEILYPALVHDWLYAQQGAVAPRAFTRAECDDIFRHLMLACGARPAQAWIAHRAVRLCGASHWQKDRPALSA